MPASLKHLLDKKLNLTSLLARWQDGLYYTAAIIKCDKTNKKCLVCFEDGSEVWINNIDVHIQLTIDQLNEDEDIVCCICDDGSSEPPNEIILCDVCQQGYHQKCHTPPVDSSKIDESQDNSDHKDWFCATCSYILNQSDSSKKVTSSTSTNTTTNNNNSAQKRQKSDNNQRTNSRQQQKRQPPPPPPIPQQPTQQSPSQSKPKVTQQQQQPTSPSEPTKLLQTSATPVQVKQSSPQLAKIKQTEPKSQPVVQQQPLLHKQAVRKSAGVGPIKPNVTTTTATTNTSAIVGGHQTAHKSTGAPYQIQPRISAAASSSTAALASMTASSALVVGSSAGRTKQDVVNQASRQQMKTNPVVSSTGGSGSGVNSEGLTTPPVKHAVRKSSVNFVMQPVKQSALPTATRSVLPTVVTSPSNSNSISISSTTTISIGASPIVSSSSTPQLQPIKQLPPQHSQVQPPPAKVPHLIATTAKAPPSLSQQQQKRTQTGITPMTITTSSLPPRISITAASPTSTTVGNSLGGTGDDGNSNPSKPISSKMNSSLSVPITAPIVNNKQMAVSSNKHLVGGTSNNTATITIQSNPTTTTGTVVSTTQTTISSSLPKLPIASVTTTTTTTTTNNATKLGLPAISSKPPVTTATPSTTTAQATTTEIANNNISKSSTNTQKDVTVVSNNTVSSSNAKPTVTMNSDLSQDGNKNNTA